MCFTPKSGICACAAVVAAIVVIGCSTSPQAKEAKYLKKGEVLMEKKDFPRALLEFRNAARAMRTDAEPQYQIGRRFSSASGNVGAAVGAFRKAIDLNPKHMGAQLKLAQLMTSSGNKALIEQAAGRLKDILSVAAENPDAADTLALAEWQLGKTDDAAKRLEDTLQRLPSRLDASVSLARIKLSQKDTAGAEEVLKRAVASAPQSSPAALALGEFYRAMRQPENAEVEIRRAIQLDASNGAALVALASIQVAGNRLEDAEKTYRQAAALPGKEYKPLHALFSYTQGKRDLALTESKVGEDDPKDRAARGRLLGAYVYMGKTAEAHALLAAALKRNGNDTDALFQRSVLFLKTGRAAEVQKDVQQVLHFQPNSPDAHYALADIYKAEGRGRSERQELNEALRLKPDMVPARIALAEELHCRRGPEVRAGSAGPGSRSAEEDVGRDCRTQLGAAGDG